MHLPFRERVVDVWTIRSGFNSSATIRLTAPMIISAKRPVNLRVIQHKRRTSDS